MTDRPQDVTEESAEVFEETPAGSFGDAAAEMANETEVEGGEAPVEEAAGPPVEEAATVHPRQGSPAGRMRRISRFSWAEVTVSSCFPPENKAKAGAIGA